MILNKQDILVIINNQEAARFKSSITTDNGCISGVLPDGREVVYNGATGHWEYLPTPGDLKKRFGFCDESEAEEQ